MAAAFSTADLEREINLALAGGDTAQNSAQKSCRIGGGGGGRVCKTVADKGAVGAGGEQHWIRERKFSEKF
jgi:hypothetical protein